MQVFFLGSVISDAEVDRILKKSKVKPSVAPVYFQKMAINGMIESGLVPEIYSLPPIKTFPGGSRLVWGKKKELFYNDKTIVNWLPTVNFFGLKQITAYVSVKKALKKWLLKNKTEKEKIVVCYSVYGPTAKAVMNLRKKYDFKTCCIITDSVDYVYNQKGNAFKLSLLKRLIAETKYLTNLFDGYVFLTKYMVSQYDVGNKPYIIMEGLCDPTLFKNIIVDKREKTLMYSGVLSKGFGIDKLVKAFHRCDCDYKLKLFGSGECEDIIKEYSAKDSRISFEGRVERSRLLKAQKSSTLLLSVKPSDEEHTKYAFPSKVLEYMTSGTPVLMTKVKGIPDEYFDYCYTIDDESVEGITKALEETLRRPLNELEEMGRRAKEFVVSNKNDKRQGQRIKELLKKIIKDEKSDQNYS